MAELELLTRDQILERRKRLMNEIELHRRIIGLLEEGLEKLKDQCPHTNLPSREDIYCTVHLCPDCDKEWKE